jgi:flagellar motor switch protein FliN/FliY
MDELEKKWEEEIRKKTAEKKEENPNEEKKENNESWQPVANGLKNEPEEEAMEEPPDDVLLALLSVPLEVSVEVGSRMITLEELFSLKPSSIIVLDKMLHQPVDIKVNGKKIAEGELVVVNDRFGVKIMKIVSQEERIKKLKS